MEKYIPVITFALLIIHTALALCIGWYHGAQDERKHAAKPVEKEQP